MRDPQTIAAELTALHQRAALAFVPLNVREALQLNVEFAQSVAATLAAAGLLVVPEAPADQPGAAG